jgi:hypothetical protein
MSRHALRCGGFCFTSSPLFEIALVLMRLDHIVRLIVNADHGIV